MTHVESWIRYGFAALRFVDATSAAVPANDGTTRSKPVPVALDLALDDLPRGVRRDDRPGLTAFDFGDLHVVEGRVFTQDDREHVPPEVAARTLRIAGSVRDPARRFQPRAIEAFDLTHKKIVDVELYPTPAATRPTGAGELFGVAAFDEKGEQPAAWCTLALAVEISTGRTYTFRAQADARGEFRIALTGLPPLPKDAEPYQGALRVRLPPVPGESDDPNVAPDPARFADAKLERPGAADTDPLTVPIRHGMREPLTTPGAAALRVKR